MEALIAKAKADGISEGAKKAAEERNRLRQQAEEAEARAVAAEMRLRALSADSEAAINQYVPAEDLPLVRQKQELTRQTVDAQAKAAELDRLRQALFIEKTLAASGIPDDHPDLKRGTWTDQNAFLNNVEMIKVKYTASSEVAGVKQALADLQKQIARLSGGQQDAQATHEAQEGAGVGTTIPTPGGQPNWLSVDDKTFDNELERRLTGYGMPSSYKK